MRNPPLISYSGITIILDQPSRFDVEDTLISGQADALLQQGLKPVNRYACDIRTVDCKDPLLPDTRVIVLMGSESLKLIKAPIEGTLSQLRGSPFDIGGIIYIPTFLPQDCIDKKNYEQYLNKALVDNTGEDDDEEDAGGNHKDKGKTARRNYKFWLLCDLQKAVRLSKTKLSVSNPNYIIYPSSAVILKWMYEQRGQKIFLDIESNPDTCELLCFSVSTGSEVIYTIPIRQYNGSLAYDKQVIADIIQGLCFLFAHNTIVIHNALFDLFIFLWKWKIPPPAYDQIEDTMIMHHRCFSDLEKSLGHVISLYTDLPYHKNESNYFPHNREQDRRLWLYNAKDVYALATVYISLSRNIIKLGASTAVQDGNRAIRWSLLFSYRGVRVELERLCKGIDTNERRREIWESKILHTLVGYKLNPRSPQQVEHYLYDQLDIRRPTGKGASMTGKKQLYKLQVKHDIPALTVILALRRLGTEQGKLKSMLWQGSRWTGTFSIAATKTFRLGSQKLLGTFGTNMQNFNKHIKKYVIPDPGHVLWQVDLSGVEAHIVAYLTPAGTRFRQLFEAIIKPHTYVATWLFTSHWNDVMGRDISYLKEKPICDLPSDENWRQLNSIIKSTDDDIPSRRYYYFAKQTCHSGNYDIGPYTFCLNLLDKSEGEVRLPLRDGARFISMYKEIIFPEIPLGFHGYVRNEIDTNHYLTNLFGYRRYALGEVDGHEIKDWYSWIPQSTGSAVIAINAATEIQAGLDNGTIPPIGMCMQDGHDSLMGQVKIGHEMEWLKIVKKHLEVTLVSPYGEPFTLRTQCQLGENWKDMKQINI